MVIYCKYIFPYWEIKIVFCLLYIFINFIILYLYSAHWDLTQPLVPSLIPFLFPLTTSFVLMWCPSYPHASIFPQVCLHCWLTGFSFWFLLFYLVLLHFSGPMKVVTDTVHLLCQWLFTKHDTGIHHSSSYPLIPTIFSPLYFSMGLVGSEIHGLGNSQLSKVDSLLNDDSLTKAESCYCLEI